MSLIPVSMLKTPKLSLDTAYVCAGTAAAWTCLLSLFARQGPPTSVWASCSRWLGWAQGADVFRHVHDWAASPARAQLLALCGGVLVFIGFLVAVFGPFHAWLNRGSEAFWLGLALDLETGHRWLAAGGAAAALVCSIIQAKLENEGNDAFQIGFTHLLAFPLILNPIQFASLFFVRSPEPKKQEKPVRLDSEALAKGISQGLIEARKHQGWGAGHRAPRLVE